MAGLKTRPSGASVAEFIQGVTDEARREDCGILLEVMRRVTGVEPEMWGSSIVGVGSHHFTYASGREGDRLHRDSHFDGSVFPPSVSGICP